MNVLNRSRDKESATQIESQAGQSVRRRAVWEMNHPDLKATHTFGDDRKVRTSDQHGGVTVQDGGFCLHVSGALADDPAAGRAVNRGATSGSEM